jgi:hypothetical protein
LARVRGHRRIVIAAAALALASRAAAQDPARDSSAARRWEIAVEARGGVPSGAVQVRENSVAGTRLTLGSGLDVHALWAAGIELDYRPDVRTRLSMELTSFGLSGTVTPTQDIYFNGTTLAAGSPLTTATTFPHYLAATFTFARRVARIGAGDLSATAGFSFVALTFVLHGTLAPGSATRETQEDFVTQELPVPELGVEYHAPLARRMTLDLRLTGGWLPWVNSLRKEGGVVTITQTAVQLATGVRYDITPALGVTGTARLSSFSQNEQSGEDGNQFAMRAVTVGVGLAQRF